MYTYHTRLIEQPLVFDYLDRFAQLYGQLERRLYVDLEIRKQALTQLKKHSIHQNQITARQFNSIYYNLKGKIQSLKEMKQDRIQKLKEDMKREARRIRELEQMKASFQRVFQTKKQTDPDFLQVVNTYRRVKFQLHHKKRNHRNLTHKLEKLTQDPFVRICFGSKRLFKAQYYLRENGFCTHEQWRRAWRDKRSSECTFIGSRDESYGNQTCQYVEGRLQVRISPQFMKEFGKILSIESVHFPYGQVRIQEALTTLFLQDRKGKAKKYTQSPITYRFKRKQKDWYVFASIQWEGQVTQTNTANGTIGLDYNIGFIQSEEIDRFGNPIKGGKKIRTSSRNYTTDSREQALSEGLEQVFRYAMAQGKSIAYEALDFKKKKQQLKSVGKAMARRLSSFDYQRYQELIQSKGKKYGVEVISVNPAYSSQQGKAKFSPRYGKTTHGGAAVEIARRGIGFGTIR